jgi:hypothetical protein
MTLRYAVTPELCGMIDEKVYSPLFDQSPAGHWVDMQAGVHNLYRSNIRTHTLSRQWKACVFFPACDYDDLKDLSSCEWFWTTTNVYKRQDVVRSQR